MLGIKPEELADSFRAADMAADAEDTAAYYTAVRALCSGEMTKPRSMDRINSKTGEHKYFSENACCIEIQGRKKKVFYFSNRAKERKTQNDLAEALHVAQAANDLILMDARIARPVQIDNLKAAIQQVLDSRL